MAARLIAALVVASCLSACAWKAPVAAVSPPSRLEKSCPAGPYYVPCFIMDEGMAQTWDV